MNSQITVKKLEEMIAGKLSHFFGVTPEQASYEQYYKALSMILRDRTREYRSEFDAKCAKNNSKRVYYMCMEFLMGRSLKNTLFNLNLTETAREALASFGVKLDSLYKLEPDPGLGNGGLGRLAACYLAYRRLRPYYPRRYDTYRYFGK